MNTPHYRAPHGAENTFNRAVKWLTDHGITLAGAQTLTVTGRKSGAPHSVPVNPLRIGEREYLVAARGEVHWVRNARVNPSAELRLGRRRAAVTLTEVDPGERAPVIRAYLKKWGWEVGRFLPEGMSTKPTDAELERYAASIPVFSVAR